MATIGSLIINLAANTANFTAGLSKARGQVATFQSGLQSTNASMARFGSTLISVGALFGGAFAIKGIIASSIDAEEKMSQLRATLKSTGGAAGLTAEEIDKLANELQDTTKFGDETTKSAAAVLATFTSIKGDVFVEALKAAQDMNTVLGGDLQSNIIQIGKALNEPIKGVTALRRVGVSFNEQQIAQIKTLVQSGETLKAQKIILAELSKEFGGSAVAAGDTFGGELEKLKNAADDLKEKLGDMLKPYLRSATEFVTSLLKSEKTLMLVGAAVTAAVTAFVVYKAAAIAVTIVNTLLTASIPVVGLIALAAAAAAGAAALVAMHKTLQQNGIEAEKAADGAKGVKVQMDEAAASAVDLSDVLKKLGDSETKKLQLGIDTAGMNEAQKAAYEFKVQSIDALLKQKAAFDELSATEQAALLGEIGRRAKIIEQMTRQQMFLKEQADANKAVADAQKELADFGLKDFEKKAKELREQGFGLQANEIERIGKELEAKQALAEATKKAQEDEKRRQEELVAIGKQRFEDSLNFTEKFRKEMADIAALQWVGAIDPTTASRERAKAFLEFRKQSLSLNAPTALNLERGTGAEVAFRQGSANDPLAKLDKTAQAQLGAQLDSLTVQRETRDLLKNDTILTIGESG